jgi:hypothetical protein
LALASDARAALGSLSASTSEATTVHHRTAIGCRHVRGMSAGHRKNVRNVAY